MAVTAKVRIGQVRFEEYGELLLGNRFLEIENEKAILKKMESYGETHVRSESGR